jgi:DNA repair photolyase
VRNHGLSGAGPFEVQLSIPGSGSVTKMVGRLAPRSGRRVHFVAAACQAGSRITVTADPVGVVDDYDRANNAVTAACPANPPGYTP